MYLCLYLWYGFNVWLKDKLGDVFFVMVLCGILFVIIVWNGGKGLLIFYLLLKFLDVNLL